MYMYQYIIYISILPFVISLFHKPYFANKMWRIVHNKDAKIILRKSNIIYSRQNMTLFEEKFQNDKLIILTPGGINGFYMMGTITYISEHYPMDKYIYSGASAGAWNSLLLSYKYDKNIIINSLINDKNIFKNQQSFAKTQNAIREHLLNNYINDNFNFSKLFIGVTQYKDCQFHTNIYSDFYSLEDAVQCCIASSHIPFITNGAFISYSNSLSFDGGFSKNPYISNGHIPFVIKPDMWKNISTNALDIMNKDLRKLYDEGYIDTAKHIDELDEFFK